VVRRGAGPTLVRTSEPTLPQALELAPSLFILSLHHHGTRTGPRKKNSGGKRPHSPTQLDSIPLTPREEALKAAMQPYNPEPDSFPFAHEELAALKAAVQQYHQEARAAVQPLLDEEVVSCMQGLGRAVNGQAAQRSRHLVRGDRASSSPRCRTGASPSTRSDTCVTCVTCANLFAPKRARTSFSPWKRTLKKRRFLKLKLVAVVAVVAVVGEPFPSPSESIIFLVRARPITPARFISSNW
jgi:hypothetical protein